MVRVPGSFGDSEFHRESQEDVQVKIEPGEEASSEVGSTTTQLNEARSADRRSARRNSVHGREADPEKPLYPPQVPPGTPADLDASRDPLTKEGKVKAKRYASADSPIKPTSYLKSSPLVAKTNVKNDTTKTTRKKMKALDPKKRTTLDPDQAGPTKIWNSCIICCAYSRMLVLWLECSTLKIVPTGLDLIQSTTLFNKNKFIVGEALQIPDPTSSPRISQPASSNYASPAEEDSDTSSEPRRMSLGSSGALMLEIRAKSQIREAHSLIDTRTDRARVAGHLVWLSAAVFRAAMSRFLAEQGMATAKPATWEAGHPGSQKVEMESVGEVVLADLHEEFDPDDLAFPSPSPAAVVAMTGAVEVHP
ncbi:hypothetical protein GQ600_27227 [Phytophthora cactorum]|nr:hypothetical protein GQ600_27227 [Phytophthora cactorum]